MLIVCVFFSVKSGSTQFQFTSEDDVKPKFAGFVVYNGTSYATLAD